MASLFSSRSFHSPALASPLGLPFLHGARSTAASPLQASFLTLRSPGWAVHHPSSHPLLDTYNNNDNDNDDDLPSVSLHTPSPPLGLLSAVNIIVGRTMGVGAYSVPAAVLAGVGSVGAALTLWVVGAALAFCGLAVYVELGTALPRSGGERVYLERMFPRPAMLATCVFLAHVVLLGFSAPNALVLGEYVLRAVGGGEADDGGRREPSQWAVRILAVFSVTAICAVHARRPRLGLALINVLGVAKLVLLGGVVVGGVAAWRERATSTGSTTPGILGRPDPDVSSGPFATSSTAPYDYATALLKVLYCFRGYSSANQVLSDVRDPVRTLQVAGPLALALVAVSYLAVNCAFFLVVAASDLQQAGIGAAALFFEQVFGPLGTHVLPLVVVVSAAGNIAATAFAQARVNEALAGDGFFPFWRAAVGNGAPPGEWGPTGSGCPSAEGSPWRGLLLHWLVSVAVIVLPPSGRIYSFLVDLGAYPVSVLSVALAAGLLVLRKSPATWASPAPAPLATIVVFLLSNALLLVLPWLPPPGGHGESDRFASYAYPAGGLAVLGSGAVYWCWWRTWRRPGSALSGSSSSHRRRPRIRLSLASLDAQEGREARDSRDVRRRRAPCGCPTIH